ncbi:hypothetical protein NPIL_357641 [Nephila pilipes]|uniref:Uncharacterized protein n=1 Tax=Nephila pilipes TaxID=299642 RepID=A0A8X6TUY3_NEPPI|nr:hypothetical protein NPIL_357641 [Nephila pilipes]
MVFRNKKETRSVLFPTIEIHVQCNDTKRIKITAILDSASNIFELKREMRDYLATKEENKKITLSLIAATLMKYSKDEEIVEASGMYIRKWISNDADLMELWKKDEFDAYSVDTSVS